MDCVVAPSVLADWLLWSEETLVVKERNATRVKPSRAGTLAGRTFKQAVETLWLRKGRSLSSLARQVDCNYTSISNQYAGFSEEPSKRTVVNKVCDFLGIDSAALFDGRIVAVSTSDPVVRAEPPAVVALAEQIAKTAMAEQAAHYLEFLLKSAEQSTSNR